MSDQPRSGNSLNWGEVLIAVVLAIGISKWLFFSNTLTTYWIYTKSGAPLGREIYSVDRSSLTVTHLHKFSDGENLITGPYKDCAIIDTDNWLCDEAGQQANDGKATGSPLGSDPRARRAGMEWDQV